ncbi:MAG: Hsp20/alpha crystallin family protein [Thermodesulfobacteriota bacterium]|nr:Hsp20/alpha crystallin family protein [Thermodesulfobacteriota bacterium]
MKSWQPVVDIFEENNQIIVKADLPGVKKENISIDVENRVLTIKGEKKLENEIIVSASAQGLYISLKFCYSLQPLQGLFLFQPILQAFFPW